MGLSRAVQISRHIPSVDERDPARTGVGIVNKNPILKG